MSNIGAFHSLLQAQAAVLFHRESLDSLVDSEDCACLTPEGFRDPLFHNREVPVAPALSEGSAGALTGTYRYIVAFVIDWNGDEKITTPASSPSLPITVSGKRITVSLDVPDDPLVVARAIYRSKNGGGYRYVATVDDTATESYTDNIADATVAAADRLPIVCNEDGKMVFNAYEFSVRAFIQPVQSTRATRLSSEAIYQLFGEVQEDDHLGIFPITWDGKQVIFQGWQKHGNDYIEVPSIFPGVPEVEPRRFTVVNSNIIPDPANGQPHHWEVGLRLISRTRPNG